MIERTRVLVALLGLGTGGAERSTVDMAPLLGDLGIDLTFHCRWRRPVGAGRNFRPKNCDIRFADDERFLPWTRELRRTIRSSGADVLHTTLFQADLAGRFAAIRTGVPVLTSIVNESYEPSRFRDPAIRPWKLEATRRLEGLTARHLSQRVHALTDSVAISCERSLGYPGERITVIPRGRDPERLGRRDPPRGASARRQLGVDPDAPLLLCMGRQEFQKGHDVLLHAFAELSADLPDARLVLAGRSGGSTAALTELISGLGLADKVILTGHVEDVASLYCAADVFAFPSRFEGLGGVLLEAMALELPVVASDIGPVRETLGGDEGAVLVPPEQPGALTAGLRRVLADENLRVRMAEHGRRRFEREYSLDSVAERMADLYREVAAVGRRTRSDHRPMRRPNSR